ncbi:MAG: TonB-dependent siderophore receptor [Cyanobacteria bacterium P01_G01_bin.67]
MKKLSEILLRLSLITKLSVGLLGIVFICSARAEEPDKKDTRETVKAALKDTATHKGAESEISFLNPLLPNSHNSSDPSIFDPEQNSRGNAADLLAKGVTRVTGVELIQTDEGLELVLETVAGSERLVPLIQPEGNDLVIEILDATLAFAIRNGITELNPAPGITSVRVNQADENSIRVRIAGTEQAPSAEILPGRDDLVLSVTPDGTAAADEPDDSINVIATGQGAEEEYFVPDASTATRTDTPIRDIPQSIQVIPQQVIEDQQAIGLDEVLNNVSGVTTGGSFSNLEETFNIRGFSDTSVLRDGFRQFGDVGQNFVETANLEQVEVLKGPASILYGEIEPGGVVNVVTKKPIEEGSLYEATLQLGNDALVSPQIDFSDALTSDGSLRYRLNALYRHENSFNNFETDSERFFVAPVISWEIGDRTDITFQLDYTNDEFPSDLGLQAAGDGIFPVSFDSIINQDDAVNESEVINVGYDLEHRFSDNWQLRNAFRFSDRDLDNVGGTAPFVDEETGIGSQSFVNQNASIQNYTLQTNVVGKFDTGSVKHTLLFGVDLNRNDDLNFVGLDPNPVPFNIFDPDFGVFDDLDPDELPIVFKNDVQSDRLGVFLQDQVDLLDNLILLAGVRYDTVEQTTVDGPTDSSPEISETTENFDDVNPRVGLVYQPIPQISLFGSYSQSFSPNTETDSSGELLEPETSEGFEFGVKGEILEGKLLATLGYFNITKKNVATPDPIDMFFSVATGEQESQGIELDIIGEIMPGWNIVASYAYIDAEVSEDNDETLVGNRLFNTPENSVSLWTTYEIQQGSLQGLGFGGGFVFVGERQGNLDNDFTVSDYFLTNAALFYKRNDWRMALNFNNLFDVDYIVATSNSRGFGNDVGDPFEVRGSVSMKF